jgi:hypothetical protein
VRVTGVQIPLGRDLTWVHEAPYMSESPSGWGLATVPFHPFTLTPGQNRDLIVTMTFGPCPQGFAQISGNEGYRDFDSAAVTSTAFGVHHTTVVSVPESVLSIQGFPGCRPS